MMQHNNGLPLFALAIQDPCTLRGVLGQFKSTVGGSKELSLALTPELMSITQSNASNTIILELVIQTSQLQHYQYHVLDERGEMAAWWTVGFQVGVLYEAIRKVGKTDILWLFMVQGDPYLHLRLIKAHGNPVSLSIPTVAGECTNLDYSSFTRRDDDPTAKISPGELTNICGQVCSGDNTIIDWDRNSIVWWGAHGKNPINSSTRTDRVVAYTLEEINTGAIGRKHIREHVSQGTFSVPKDAIGHIGRICPTCTKGAQISVYAERDILRFRIPVGVLGALVIVIYPGRQD
jgi:hypothetical protein